MIARGSRRNIFLPEMRMPDEIKEPSDSNDGHFILPMWHCDGIAYD